MDRVRLLLGSRRWPLLAALALLSLALGLAMFSGAKFTSKSANSASLVAGSIKLSSSKPNQAILSDTKMEPGKASEGTIAIGNEGDVAGTVTLKASGLSGAALASVLDLKIEDVTSGTTQKYSGKLGSFTSVGLGSFAAGTTRNYKLTLSWPAAAKEASLQGTAISASLEWELDNGFTDTSKNSLSVSAAPDWTAPTVEAGAIAKTQEGLPGYIKQGGTYYVYANAADSGNPASGIGSVRANVSAITTGQSAVMLSSAEGPFTVAGVAYAYRSALLTASSPLSGTKSFTVTATDALGRSSSPASFSVTVENAPFAGSQIATANGTGSSGKADKGDTVSFTYNKAPDPYAILPGWSGALASTVAVSIVNNSSSDTLTVTGTRLGSVALEGNYVSETTTFSGSTIALSGSTVTVTLGQPSASTRSETGKNELAWTPSSSAYDLAGNAAATTKVIGANVRQF